MALFLTQKELDASLNEAQLILRSGARTAGFISLQSKQRAVDLLEEIVEACDNATAAPMLRTQNVAKYELAGTLQAHPHFDKARGLLLQAATPKAQIVGGRCDGGARCCHLCCVAARVAPL